VQVRVRIARSPSESSIDGFPLWHLQVGLVYAIPAAVATLMIVEGWAEPVVDDAEPTLPMVKFDVARPRRERRRRYMSLSRLRQELGIAADRRRRWRS
jgi:hypothetical protein